MELGGHFSSKKSGVELPRMRGLDLTPPSGPCAMRLPQLSEFAGHGEKSSFVNTANSLPFRAPNGFSL